LVDDGLEERHMRRIVQIDPDSSLVGTTHIAPALPGRMLKKGLLVGKWA
jgi:hypothetical protein